MRTTKKASSFPAFEVPKDAQIIPASRIQKALDEDGVAEDRLPLLNLVRPARRANARKR